MIELSYTTIGDRKAFVLPGGVAPATPLNDGDRLKLIETPAGILLCKINDETAVQLEIAQDVMERRRDALRRLAE